MIEITCKKTIPFFSLFLFFYIFFVVGFAGKKYNMIVKVRTFHWLVDLRSFILLYVCLFLSLVFFSLFLVGGLFFFSFFFFSKLSKIFYRNFLFSLLEYNVNLPKEVLYVGGNHFLAVISTLEVFSFISVGVLIGYLGIRQPFMP